jgi:hypothetical protein
MSGAAWLIDTVSPHHSAKRQSLIKLAVKISFQIDNSALKPVELQKCPPPILRICLMRKVLSHWTTVTDFNENAKPSNPSKG